MMTRPGPWGWAWPAAALLGGTVGGPLLVVVALSFSGDPSANYAPLFTRDAARMIAITLSTAAAIAGLSVLIGLVIALRIHANRRARRLLIGLVVAPKLAGALAVLLGLRVLLSRLDSPLLGTWLGSVLAEFMLVVPYVAIMLVAALDRQDPQFSIAARTLGANRGQVFARITWPLLQRTIFTATLIAFLWGLGAIFGPVLFGGPRHWTLAAEVYRQAFDYANPPRAAAVAVALMMLASVPMMVWVWAVHRESRA